MNYILLIVCVTLCVLFLRKVYVSGTKRALKSFVSILVSLLLAGTATRIGRIVLPESITISYYIAGIGAILFYFILSPIIQKESPDRYRRISQESRSLAVLIGLCSIVLILSFVYFFVRLFVSNSLGIPSDVSRAMLIPIRFLWMFPHW